MKEIKVTAPEIAFPKKDPEHPCACQFRPFSLRDLECTMTWVKKPGEKVREGEILYEAEAAWKMLEFPSPAGGILKTAAVPDGGKFKAGDTVCFLTEE